MPLSEQEQRLLEEMERSLYQNDADFVATIVPRQGKTNYTILAIGVLVAVAGIATLVAGVIVRQPIVGVLGFVIMFVGVLLAVAPPRSTRTTANSASSGSSSKKSAPSSTFMDNLNERWDKRQDGRD
jgi:predicted phage tail protein